MPKSRGRSDRVSNLTLACQRCNQEKDNRTAEEFGRPEVQAKAKRPIKDAAAVNATRWALYERLKGYGLPVETGSGGLTKYNRTVRDLPKGHWVDAACVGKSTPAQIVVDGLNLLEIKAIGHNTRQMRQMDKYGFPRTSAKGQRTVKGFRSGDLVEAKVRAGKKMGTYVGRVAVRISGSFNVTTASGTIQGISHRYCRVLHKADGYGINRAYARSQNSSPSKLTKMFAMDGVSF